MLNVWENISFLWPYAGLLWPLPLLLYWRYRKVQSQAQQMPIYMPTYAQLSLPARGGQRGQSRWLRWVLLLCIWSGLVFALMRPTFYGEPIALPQEGRDLFIAVDLSGSMQTQDMLVNDQQVDRLVMVKHVLKDFIRERVGDRLGLILFADTAYLQAPLTFDRNTVQTLLDQTVLGLVGESTAIGDAIGLAAKRLADREVTHKVLILLTDGQNTAGNISPEQALEVALAQGITIYPIGVGAERMVVNSLFGQRQVNPSADLDEALLNRLAADTGGRYFRARDTEELREIYRVLNQIEPVIDESQTIRPQRSLFFYGVAFALIVLWLWWCLMWSNRRFKWSLPL
jgi:Ca-activated chloride channel family protein